MGRQVYSPYADGMLAFLFYLEAIFFLPTDPMLVMYCVTRRELSFRYATIATIASVFGGLTSYALGYFIWYYAGDYIMYNPIINCVVSPDMFTYVCEQYRIYDYWGVLIAGFTPIPYKAATLAAGFCRLSIVPFTIYSCIARGARFYLLALLIYIWGPQIQECIDRYFNLLVVLVIVVAIIIIKYLLS